MSQKRKRLEQEPLHGYPVDDGLTKRLKSSPLVTVEILRNALRTHFGFDAPMGMALDDLLRTYVGMCNGNRTQTVDLETTERRQVVNPVGHFDLTPN
jgi:hypothetical protein